MSDYIKREDALFVAYQQPFSSVVTQIKMLDGIDIEKNYVPREFHDKTCEAMAKRHQEEIADMVSVVRCKECKYANTEDCSHSYWDDDWGEWRVDYRGDDWFCADGEREGERMGVDKEYIISHCEDKQRLYGIDICMLQTEPCKMAVEKDRCPKIWWEQKEGK